MLKRLLAWCCTLVFLAAPAWAETDAATAEALMRKSGLWEQLADIQQQTLTGMLAALAQSASKPTQSEVERLSRAMASAYSAGRLRAACLAAISRELDPSQIAALSRWYDGPVGKTIATLEVNLSRQGESRETVERGIALLRDMAPTRRRTLDGIVLATRAGELAAELTISTALTTQLAAASVSSNPPASTRELKAALEARRQLLIRNYGAIALAAFAAAFSGVPTVDLATYVDFLKSDAGHHYTEVGMRAVSAAMLNAAAEFGRTLPGARDRGHT